MEDERKESIELDIVDIYPIKVETIDGNILTIAESPYEYVRERQKLNSFQMNLCGIYEDLIKDNRAFCQWKAAMPTIELLNHIHNYQRQFNSLEPESHTEGLDTDFKEINTILPIGQILFHGGYWFNENSDEIISHKYWSTSLTPHYATAATSGEHKGRPSNYMIQLFLIKIMTSGIKFYCYDNTVETRYREFEILLEKNIKLVKKEIYCLEVSGQTIEIISVEAYKI